MHVFALPWPGRAHLCVPCTVLPRAGEVEAEVGAGVAGSIGGEKQLGLAVPHLRGLQAIVPAQHAKTWMHADAHKLRVQHSKPEMVEGCTRMGATASRLRTTSLPCCLNVNMHNSVQPCGAGPRAAQAGTQIAAPHSVRRKVMAWDRKPRRSYRCTVTLRLVAACSNPSCKWIGYWLLQMINFR